MGNEGAQTGLRSRSTNTEASFDPELLRREILLEQFLSQWRFFDPPALIVEEILRLNERLVENHLDQDEILRETDESFVLDQSQDSAWFKRVFAEAAETLFHNSTNRGNRVQNERQPLSYFQSFIGERIYNRLAMLSRTPHARGGGAFSIREELTEELAGKIGLGLYLRLDSDNELRNECDHVLLGLASEFQGWLVKERNGFYFAPWGVVCIPQKREALKDLYDQPQLIMEPDVELSLKAGMRALNQTV